MRMLSLIQATESMPFKSLSMSCISVKEGWVMKVAPLIQGYDSRSNYIPSQEVIRSSGSSKLASTLHSLICQHNICMPVPGLSSPVVNLPVLVGMQCVMLFSWYQSIFDGWVMAGWSARCPLLWVATEAMDSKPSSKSRSNLLISGFT